MSQLFSAKGVMGRAVDAEIGLDSQGRKRARWTMEITQGEHKGKTAAYSGKLDPDNIKWTMKDMKAIGWKGERSATFVSDVETAKLEVPFDAEIAEYNGNTWVSAKFGGAAPLAPLDKDSEREIDKLFAQAGEGESRNGNSSSVPF
jgi:hypothetical protein